MHFHRIIGTRTGMATVEKKYSKRTDTATAKGGHHRRSTNGERWAKNSELRTKNEPSKLDSGQNLR